MESRNEADKNEADKNEADKIGDSLKTEQRYSRMKLKGKILLVSTVYNPVYY